MIVMVSLELHGSNGILSSIKNTMSDRHIVKNNSTNFWRATLLQDAYTLIAVLTQDEKVDLYFDEALHA